MACRPCYDQLTDWQRDQLCNGCGRKGGLAKPPDFIFRADCNRHDFEYWVGGGVLDRLKSDLKFLARMLLRTCARAESWWQLVQWVGVAISYFTAVRWFGWSAFNWHGPRTEADLP